MEVNAEMLKLVSDEAVEAAFQNTVFGDVSRREIIADVLLKIASGYSAGRTAHAVCAELGLMKCDKRGKYTLTVKGGYYLYEAFKDHLKPTT